MGTWLYSMNFNQSYNPSRAIKINLSTKYVLYHRCRSMYGAPSCTNAFDRFTMKFLPSYYIHIQFRYDQLIK